ESLGESQAVQLKRAQVIGDLFRLVQGLSRRVGNLFELLEGPRAIAGVAEAQRRAVLDDDEALIQAVVQLGGNALALGFLRGDQLAREGLLPGLCALELSDAVLIAEPDDTGDGERGQADKPPGAIKRRQYADAQALSLLVPHSIAVGGHDSEGVLARRH